MTDLAQLGAAAPLVQRLPARPGCKLGEPLVITMRRECAWLVMLVRDYCDRGGKRWDGYDAIPISGTRHDDRSDAIAELKQITEGALQ